VTPEAWAAAMESFELRMYEQQLAYGVDFWTALLRWVAR
jgi:hypothetical protein